MGTSHRVWKIINGPGKIVHEPLMAHFKNGEYAVKFIVSIRTKPII